MAAHITGGLSRHVLAVNLKYLVSLAKSGLRGGHVLVRLVYYAPLKTLVVTNERSYASILAGKHRLKVGLALLRIIFGIWVERLEHGVNAGRNHLACVQRIDVH